MVSPGKKSWLFMGFGAGVVVLGAIMAIFWPPLFMSQLRRMMTLTPDSMSFEMWRETPIPMYLEVYFFNITNVDAILERQEGVKLQVKEMGPYVFREQHIKTNLTWNDHNDTLTFYNQRWWHFIPERSVGELSDMVTTVNPIVVTVAYLMRHELWPVRAAVNAFLRTVHPNMFTSANVSAWLFDGLDDRVLDIANEFPNLPFTIPYDRFGWFYERNGSIEFDGSFNINTGAADFSQLGNVQEWRYSNRTTFGGDCGRVMGSTGELWAPEYGQEEVYVFSSDLCTYLTLSNTKDVTVTGIDGVMYAANASTFDNGHNYPHMACFCAAPVTSAECAPAGALDVSRCRFGAPAFVSLPHFLHADPYYAERVDGLNATEDMNFRLILEMFTGMPLAVSAQLQINLFVRHVGGIPINNILPDAQTMVPMFYFRQEMEITEEYAAQARFAIRMRYWVPYGFYALTAIGLVLLSVGISILVRKILKSPETTPILNEETTTEQ